MFGPDYSMGPGPPGTRMNGRTPAQAFVQGLPKALPVSGLTEPDVTQRQHRKRREKPKPETEPQTTAI